jgi:hypothetical protein
VSFTSSAWCLWPWELFNIHSITGLFGKKITAKPWSKKLDGLDYGCFPFEFFIPGRRPPRKIFPSQKQCSLLRSSSIIIASRKS